MKRETLESIKTETERFLKRLNAAIAVAESTKAYKWNADECHNCNEAGALKRSALDLKLELTKITSPKY